MNDSRVSFILKAKEKRDERRSEIFKPTSFSNIKGYSQLSKEITLPAASTLEKRNY